MKSLTLRTLSLLLTLCLLMGSLALVSCSISSEGGDETPESGTVTEAPETEDPRATLDNPEVNYNGYTFRVCSIASEIHYSALDPEKMSGQAVNDAIFERNRKIESEYGIEFDCVTDDYDATYILLEKQVMAGSSAGDDFDLIMQICRNAYKATLRNLLINYDKLPYVDTDKEYYFSDINEQFSIGGKTFFAYGYENINVFSVSSVLFFNKDIAKERDMGDLYQSVRDRSWTMDRLYTLAAEAVSDENGDGKFRLGEDVLGLVGNYDRTIPCFWVCAGEKLVSKDENDLPIYTANGNERMIGIMQEAAAHFATDAFDVYGADSKRLAAFMDGKSLFMATVIGELSNAKAAEIDYGVLPWPMYDTNQERYVSRCIDAWLHCVPANAEDPERTSVIMQALAYYSYGTVYKAYYDQALTAQYVRDPESVEMMQMIFSSVAVDLGDTIWYEKLRLPIVNAFLNKKANIGVASTFKTYERMAGREIEAVMEFLAKQETE